MDHAAMVEKRPRRTGKHSVHSSQLDVRKERVRQLSVQNPDGSIININEPEGKLKFAFTGGTDDPALELSLRDISPSSPPPLENLYPSTMAFIFHAFPSSTLDFVYPDRKVREFRPEERVEVPLENDVLGPTSFTNALYNLCLERFEDNALQLKPSRTSYELARSFSEIAEKQHAQQSEGQKFTVELLETPDFQYGYRYLLACPTGLQAYWRCRLRPNLEQGNVPVELCELLPLQSLEVQELESANPSVSMDWNSSKYFPDNTHPLQTSFAFSSKAQVDSDVKGPLLYEEHAISHLRKRFLHQPWTIEFEILKGGQENSSAPVMVAFLSLPTETTRYVTSDIIPKEGSAVTLKWIPLGFDHFKASPWMGVLLKAEVGFFQRVRLAILVWPCTPLPISTTLLFQTHHPSFDFSMDPNNLGFILNSIDNLLFHYEKLPVHNPAATRILDILMARDNHKKMDEALITVSNRDSMCRVTSRLDKSQQKTMSRLLKERLTIINGPDASGKTMLAAIFGALCIQSGENVCFLARTNTSLKKLFRKVDEISTKLQLPFSTIEQFRLSSNVHPLPTERTILEKMLSNIEWTNKYGFSRPVKADLSKMNLSNQPPTAQFTTYDELDNLSLEYFGATVLICLDAERAHDHSIFAACGHFSATLQKVALIGNSSKIPIDVTSRELNHRRHQLVLTTFWRLICTGIEPARLEMQYRMDSEISAIPARHFYWARSQHKRVVLDGIMARAIPNRNVMKYWVAKYLSKEMKNAQLSVFANVTDGICLQDRKSKARANHHNMVAVLDILQSMINSNLPTENIVVVTFFPEAVVAMQEFLTSQGLSNIRVQHLDSDNRNAEEDLIGIIDFPFTGHVTRDSFEGMPGQGEQLSSLKRAQKLASALCVPRALRVFVANASLVRSTAGYEWQDSPGHNLLKDLVQSHRKDRQVKELTIGERLLEYEEVLRPGDFVCAFDKEKDATDIYKEIAQQQEKAKEKPEHPTGVSEEGQVESGNPKTSARTWADAAAAIGAEVAALEKAVESPRKGENQGTGRGNVERDLESSWRGHFGNAFNSFPRRGMSSQHTTDSDKAARIRTMNWRTGS
ncbi:hypothetical protein L207DRAFT_592434 [Hyaloscypha variabilis F]|uniref:DNA2/NAM7 helicase-like C-terminal domain-containing protein n=1 Tax=Hyaloscypha variabilis (strain UAMH 11265 / GT02V1 / F) TaxID=1149755 RepID=A0A2J6QWP2_HYAVF|nr:hypothetical protein L207DRAFT_592434 [Hyaloscypha variabilis F]